MFDNNHRPCWPLHESLTTRDATYSHQELQLVVTRYFRQDIETLLARDMA